MSYYDREYYRPDFSFRRCSNAVKCLVIVNVAVFIVQWISFAVLRGNLYYIFGLVPRLVTEKYFLWQLVTYMFLHGGIFHLFINCFVLYMFGKPLEELWGSARFLKYYFICGVGAGIFITSTSYGNALPTVGASGAIYGLLAAYALFFPESTIYLYFLFPIKAKYFVIILGVISFLSGIADRGSFISHFGHLGGLIVGFVYLKYRQIMNFFSRGLRSTKEFDTIEGDYHDDRPSEEKVNRILDKILKEGINSLTPEEKRIMDNYTAKESDRWKEV